MNNQNKETSNGIDITLMKKMLNNGAYYESLKKGTLSSYRCFSIDGKTNNSIDVLNNIKEALEKGKLSLNEEQKNNFNYLLDNVSINRFIEDYKDKVFTVLLKGTKVNIPCSYFIQILTLSKDDYNNFFTEDIKEFNGYDKKLFLYLFMSFINKELLYRNYIFQGEYKRRIDEIANCERIDVQYLYYDNPREKKYDNLDSFNLTYELKQEVLKDIPNDLDSVEKAIYFYIKLCKILAYDPEFYALGQGIYGVDKHHGIDNISFVTPDNNEVVCYEFCGIYAKLIKELGFDYEIEGDLIASVLGEHQSLKALLDKYFVSIDSVTSVLYGDMIRAKLNQPLEGINCYNKSKKSRKEFKLKLVKVYSLIVNQEKNKIKDYTKLTFDELFKQYGLNPKECDFKEKIEVLVKEANKAKLKTVDSMGYIRRLVKTLFSSSETDYNIKFSVISDKLRAKNGQKATASGIFTIIDGKEEIYLLYNDSEKSLIPIAKTDLVDMFSKGDLNYIDKQSVKIPGIDVNGFSVIK